jgi:rubrerythrin
MAVIAAQTRLMDSKWCATSIEMPLERKRKQMEGNNWQCSMCTFINESNVDSCTICENKRLRGDVNEGNFNVKANLESNLGGKEEEDGLWTCSRCTLINSIKREFCDACEARREKIPERNVIVLD